jgi:hypothetical protein
LKEQYWNITIPPCAGPELVAMCAPRINVSLVNSVQTGRLVTVSRSLLKKFKSYVPWKAWGLQVKDRQRSGYHIAFSRVKACGGLMQVL